MTGKQILLLNLSGRGDKDVESVLAWEEAHGSHGDGGRNEGGRGA